ncbi:uncharacterized protein BO72DRAFT_219752 [Aspergillus fijiensis CBS 313.89]|uniref:Uncharacterized protein n=1 Tax=Aspergillus fijiensis CBS 313.89 TaxID=1448319 RepID=A0A8G1RIS3_9EURO|nr:uncharacterized protein BO72DRAFT_219752 [Aspergillus fijiensis CBS 313.89]RAK74034.1 hypothetical protein BO72DRAFT_219752 [Aspergillus fijiensis CBS 313.89]
MPPPFHLPRDRPADAVSNTSTSKQGSHYANMGNMKDTDKKSKEPVETDATDRPKEEAASDKDTDIIERRLHLVEILKVFSIVQARIPNGDYGHLLLQISEGDFPNFPRRITAQYDGTPGPPEVVFITERTLSTDEIIAANRELPEPNCETTRQHKL